MDSHQTPIVVEAEHLRKSFGDNHVLKDINLRLAKGENLAILGQSGTGKSVLIKCMVGLLFPDAGRLLVLGKDVADLDDRGLDEMRMKVGFLFQSGALYDSMTVRENLEFPIRRQMRSKSSAEISALVEESLENVGLSEAIDVMPVELSGGMRKRLGLARTLILKPEIMLYDEPTTGLDPITSRGISSLILEVQEKYNTTSIIVTHDLECTRIVANRVVMLEKGICVAEGTYEDLRQSNDPWVRSFFE
ncbi:MAG: ABC transporter ATP-binding protein [Candidatus Raymondbacteria bacterium RifOxyA12_full_50_37]|uniref:ABC transporter ATP-binding protein n=1 Tax=Candidatus Raymondbacteria bacterium RIFOXYD12_FULL_49_13 TaxID=1817890 RepID=A0A1F7FAX2_UNCRA|nr:MAG: ABC transporter ATP-binding protein [Candidatus Raymondbacteria bacterium RifOxyA12_full_50_37]OGJ92357.1 MAG: ABC transporter ATP-binding protein [Candidatus Raymondbacteria bacterium RIFOXYA2_FULL_49_16]OGJ96157.1 MAG: ABC transporter ATP-binding protein [Candidatus Raymondbacteria bacterium RifOxyB12_full_50_8]OGJ99338.1 MAG: ABC transporter ATP-binding protein [Candidatus Raymondbacteria bacterium RIFOXYC2_FULL_50_21]OGK03647.1 MAG: ABC transporter ATP-binding protein [Candidatus Ra